ncbi:MAG: hypothetical protein ACJAS4_003767 [Bacteriovoracaceae bacterium]|jgi:hypothetical protein
MKKQIILNDKFIPPKIVQRENYYLEVLAGKIIT